MDSRYLKLFFRVWIFRPVWKRRRRDLRKEFYSHFLRELQVLPQVLVSGGSVQVNISHFASNWMYLCLYPNRTESSFWFRFVFSRPELNWADIERSLGYPKNVTQKQLFHELFQKKKKTYFAWSGKVWKVSRTNTSANGAVKPHSNTYWVIFLEMLSNLLFLYFCMSSENFTSRWEFVWFEVCNVLLFAKTINVRYCKGAFETANARGFL